MQTQDAVARRALALGLMSLRAQYENGINYNDDAEAVERYRKRGQALIDWAREQQVTTFLSKEERKLHRKKLGQWNREDIGERFWRIESFKAVLWCIGVLTERPSYFEVGPVMDFYARLPEGQDVTPFLAQAKLRDVAEIARERQIAQFLNWRCRTELLRLRGLSPPEGDSYEAVVARALPTLTENGFPIEHDDVDILVNGVRFTDLGEDRGDVMSICYERHLAVEWVMGNGDWDDARADT